MPATVNIHRVSIAMVVIIAMVAVLLPLCMMMACGMSASQMMDSATLGLGSACVSTMTSGAQAAVAPGNLQSLIMMLVAVMGLVFMLASPKPDVRLVRIVDEDPPPPPEDPRGARFIV